jgi:hypothetical protein
MGHGSSTTHKDVCDIALGGWCIQGHGTLIKRLEVWHIGGCHFSYIFFPQFVSKIVTTITTTTTQMLYNNNNG